MTLKRTQVVMLPTNGRSSIILRQDNKLFFNGYGREMGKEHGLVNDTPQHLYFLSDEEIKEGDWAFNTYSNSIFKITKVLNDGYEGNKLTNSKIDTNCYYGLGNTLKKIIATTHILLTDKGNARYPYGIPLPQPSQDFINVFVEEYNKGNVIEWVDVDYEISNAVYVNQEMIFPIMESMATYKLKINSKNEISIRKVKDS